MASETLGAWAGQVPLDLPTTACPNNECREQKYLVLTVPYHAVDDPRPVLWHWRCKKCGTQWDVLTRQGVDSQRQDPCHESDRPVPTQ